MNLATTLIGAAAGMVAGVPLWVWLRTGRYRLSEDQPRLNLAHTKVVVPAAAAAGARLTQDITVGLMRPRPSLVCWATRGW